MLKQYQLNNRSKFISILTLICIFYSLNALGQDYQQWTRADVRYNFKSSWMAQMEARYNHLISGGPIWREFGIQPSIEYFPDNNFDLFGGILFTFTEQTEDSNSEELRPFLGVRWNIIKPERRVYLRTQLKYESRFFKDVSDNTTSKSNRIRLRLDLTVPITQKSYNMDKDLYSMLRIEYFQNFDEDVKERFWNRGRVYAGLGYRFDYNWRLEFSYIYQASRDQSGERFDSNQSNITYLRLKYYISKKKKGEE